MQANPLAMLTKVTFKGAMTPMPFKFKFPSDMQQYMQAFTPIEKVGIINPMWLFFAVSTNTYHTVAAAVAHQKFEKYIEGVIMAVCAAHDDWCKAAVIVNGKVNGPTCMGQAGCLKGPPLEKLILSKPDLPMKTEMEQKYSKAIAKAIGKAFDDWAKNVTIPGLPWYPAFAAFPGPTAPPMPNIPTPLIVLPSTKLSEMTPPKLEKAMADAHGDKKANHAAVLFKALSVGFGTFFLAWLGATMVTNVMGTGPIPSFAPPFVPVGPVVNGTANSAGPPLVHIPSAFATLKVPKPPEEMEKIKQQMKKAEQDAKNAESKAKSELKKLNAEAEKAMKQQG